jgi:hypothetical protein
MRAFLKHDFFFLDVGEVGCYAYFNYVQHKVPKYRYSVTIQRHVLLARS